MKMIVVSVIAGLIFGSVIAFINSRITKKLLIDNAEKIKAENYGTARVMLVNILRFLTSAAALLIVYLLRNILPFHFVAGIAGTAVGLTFISYLFLWLLVRDKK